jgi:hypothetical protein
MKAKIVMVSVFLMLVAAILACGSGGSSSELTNAALRKVCTGEGDDRAAFYGSANDGEGPFPVVIFRRASAENQAWFLLGSQEIGEDMPAGWVSSKGTQTEMVVCLTVIDRELVNECRYSKTGDTQTEQVELIIELYNTSYEAVLRNARTAEEYDTTTFVSESDGVCEQSVLELIDQDVRQVDATPASGLVSFLEPWVVK